MSRPFRLVLLAAMLAVAVLPSHAASFDAARLQQQVAEREYELSNEGAGWQAPNRAQGFRTRFEADGIRLVPREAGTDGWEWGLSLNGVGRPGALAKAA